MRTVEVHKKITHVVAGPAGEWLVAGDTGFFVPGEPEPVIKPPAGEVPYTLGACDWSCGTLSALWRTRTSAVLVRYTCERGGWKRMEDVEIDPLFGNDWYDLFTRKVCGVEVTLAVGRCTGVSFRVGSGTFFRAEKIYGAFLMDTEVVKVGQCVTRTRLTPETLEDRLRLSDGDLVSKQDWPAWAGISFSAASRLLIFHTDKGRMFVAPLDTPHAARWWQGPTPIRRFFFDKTGKHVIIHSRRNCVGVYEPISGTCLMALEWQKGSRYAKEQRFQRHITLSEDGMVCALLMSEGGKRQMLFFDVEI